jgi:hypothetical protein
MFKKSQLSLDNTNEKGSVCSCNFTLFPSNNILVCNDFA